MPAIRVPQQHGAWAFLIVPLVLGALLGAGTWAGLVFAIAWIAAYPASYFGGRALVYRLRRGSWTRKARTELTSAAPWALAAAIGAAVLVVRQPALLLAGAGMAVVWTVSLWLTWHGRERGVVNDLLMVALAAAAPWLMWFSGADPSDAVPSGIVLACAVTALFFTGSVLHVKSLIREADDRRWHAASIAYHVAALALAAWLGLWLLLPFGVALVRTVVMRPPLRPAVIGAVEIVTSVLLVIGTLLATRV